MPITHIALVGHCGFDSGSLSRFAKQAAPLAEITRVNDQAAVDALAKPGTLLLINRVLDGSFRTSSGIDMIKSLANQDEGPAVMLISNYEDAQQEAMDAGALRGFGKSHLGDSITLARLADLIASL